MLHKKSNISKLDFSYILWNFLELITLLTYPEISPIFIGPSSVTADMEVRYACLISW